MSNHVDPSKKQFKRFAETSGEGPIWMLNLIRLRKKAKYDDKRDLSGREAYAEYGRASEPFFRGVGGRIVWTGKPDATLIGPDDEDWDLAFIAEYPDSAAFISMVKNESYQAIVHHRQAAVKTSRLIRIRPGEAERLFG